MRKCQGFIITNRKMSQFVGCGAGYYASDFMRHAVIFNNVEQAASIIKDAPPTVEYWRDRKLARLMRTAVVKPVTLTIEE